MRSSLPDVVLVVFDTARWDRFGCYGYGRPTTPTTDSLARDGTVVDVMISNAPWTLPSHASLFTGLYPSEHGAQWQMGRRLGPSVRSTMAEVLRGTGYETVCATSNGLISATTRLARGFDRYVHRSQLDRGWRRRARQLRRLLAGGDAGGRRLNGWLREVLPRVRAPMFLFVNYLECHWPYAPPRRLHRAVGGERLSVSDDLRLRRMLARRTGPWDAIAMADEELLAVYSSLYDGEHRNVDELLDELLDVLRATGHLREGEAVVIVTSDHGEHIGEHGLADHQASLDDHLIRVPFIAWGPGIVPSVRLGGPYEFVDVLPSVTSLLGLTWPDGVPGDRRTGLFGAAERKVEDLAFAEWRAWAAEDLARVSARHPRYDFAPLARDLRCVRDARFKLVEAGDGSRSLFDLAEDPAEERDVAASHQAELARLGAALHHRSTAWEEAAAGAAGLTGEQEAEIERRLTELGYL